MIDAALGLIVDQLNQHFRRNLNTPENFVVLSNLYEQSGALVPHVGNKLVLFLSGIERDSVAHRNATPNSGYTSQIAPAPATSGIRPTSSRMQRPEPIFLNLMVMCAATFSGSNYSEALKFLSGVIAYFQGNPVFDHQNTPDLNPGLEKLTLSIENMSMTEMHSLWTIHGGRYLPSVLYRLRLVVIDGGYVIGRLPEVLQPQVRVLS